VTSELHIDQLVTDELVQTRVCQQGWSLRLVLPDQLVSDRGLTGCLVTKTLFGSLDRGT
jgi:hypothetical protein